MNVRWPISLLETRLENPRAVHVRVKNVARWSERKGKEETSEVSNFETRERVYPKRDQIACTILCISQRYVGDKGRGGRVWYFGSHVRYSGRTLGQSQFFYMSREKAETCTFAQRLSNCRRDGIFEAPRIFELQITYFCKLHLTLPEDSSTLLRRKL